jgi:POT family proton-dependent oligopeptide transporter
MAYRTQPDHQTKRWPAGIPYIIGNECCERFSFYGMKSILYVHLVSLFVLSGYVAENAQNQATANVHLFITGVYAFPMIGAIIADRFWGKYNTILYLSLIYCAGHGVLAIGENSFTGMALGLSLIAIGSGGIKPCVSAVVGDQFGKGNWFRITSVYQIFYFSINLGSTFSTLLIPWIKVAYGTSVAFAIPGILMFIATAIFWFGRRKFVHIPPKPGGKLGLLDTASSICLFMTVGSLAFTTSYSAVVVVLISLAFLVIGLVLFGLRQRIEPDDGLLAVVFHCATEHLKGFKEIAHLSIPKNKLASGRFWRPAVARFGHKVVEGPAAVVNIITVFLFVSVFWALFDQHASSWIRQAAMMDLSFDLPIIGKGNMLPSQLPTANPIMVMILIPLMNFVYKGSAKIGVDPTPLRRMTTGMLLASTAFVSVALLQRHIDGSPPQSVSALWQLIPYLLITMSEILVSITGLEFAYTQAPNRMKSTIMGFWLLTVSLGNIIVTLLARFGNLPLVSFFWVFAGLMALAGLLFAFRANYYKMQSFTQ